MEKEIELNNLTRQRNYWKKRALIAEDALIVIHIGQPYDGGFNMANIEENRLAVKSGDIFHDKSSPVGCPAAPTFNKAQDFVKDWLFNSQSRNSVGEEWSKNQIADVAKMIQSFILNKR